MNEQVVLCYGDSNTHGTSALEEDLSWYRFDAATRWPMRMASVLGPGFRVIEEGLPGRTTVHDDPIEGAHMNGLTGLPAILASHAPLDHVVLMLGTNDLKARFSVTPADIAQSVARLILEVRRWRCGPKARSPRIIAVAPPPITEGGILGGHFTGGEAKSRALAPLIAAKARVLGASFFDAGQVAETDPKDGIHLTEASHARLAEALAEIVRDRRA